MTVLRAVYGCLRYEHLPHFEKPEIYVGHQVKALQDKGNYPLQKKLVSKDDDLAEQIKLNVLLLSCAVFYNFEQVAVEMFEGPENHVALSTFLYLTESVLPSDLNSL